MATTGAGSLHRFQCLRHRWAPYARTQSGNSHLDRLPRAATRGYDNDGGFGTVAWVRTKEVLTRPVFVASMADIMYDALLPQRPNTDAYQHAVNRVLGLRPLYILAQVSYCVYEYCMPSWDSF